MLIFMSAINNSNYRPITGAICRSKKVFFHTDAAQGVGKLPISVDECNIDVMSISGHKLYGPKGWGWAEVGGDGREERDGIERRMWKEGLEWLVG